MTEQSTRNLYRSVKSYARDLEDHLDDLYEQAEGQPTGRVLFARDRIRQAIAELEKIDQEDL